MEHERKFRLERPPQGLRANPHRRIRQGYLAIPSRADKTPVEVRVRHDGGKHLLTVKGGRGASRVEVELPLQAEDFRVLWRLTHGKRVEKTRYRVRLGAATVEVDVYHGKLRGLMVAEVEFESAAQLRAFRPPEWLGREVTGRREFENSQLATRSAPPRTSGR